MQKLNFYPKTFHHFCINIAHSICQPATPNAYPKKQTFWDTHRECFLTLPNHDPRRHRQETQPAHCAPAEHLPIVPPRSKARGDRLRRE
jgi:hypothetical protein